MHYYQFNIGDYAKATRHLSNLEDLAYRRLIEFYYDTEKPLIKDIKKLSRLVNMRENQEEIQTIIDDFFYKTEEGYKQNRIEKELKIYHLKADVARENGKKGGRPRGSKKTQTKPSGLDIGTQNKPNGNPEKSESKANQEPRTKNQEPLTKNKVKKTSVTSDYSEAFERWWLIYPKRNGRIIGKQKTYPLFKRIPQSEYEDLKKATLNYANTKYITDPHRFLKDNTWKDYIEDAEPFEEQNRFQKPPNPSCEELAVEIDADLKDQKAAWNTPKEVKLINQG